VTTVSDARAVMCDMGGVLINSEPFHGRASKRSWEPGMACVGVTDPCPPGQLREADPAVTDPGEVGLGRLRPKAGGHHAG
jgi:beta-phosphoglucomutase-like phosphatase (HAD superfamily)